MQSSAKSIFNTQLQKKKGKEGKGEENAAQE